MSSKRAREPGSDDENEHGSCKRTQVPPTRPHSIIHNHHYSPVNQIGQVNNAHLGTNNGFITQGNYGPPPGMPSVSRPPIDLNAVLNPILDASHTRNLKLSPPNSKCFPKTREKVIGMVLSWGRSDLRKADPHILWIYGYAGCGKSAISQAVAEQLALEGRLAASFFFFRGSGNRSKAFQFVNTLAHQLALARRDAAAVIEEVVGADHGVRSLSTSSLFVQFRRLVLEPIATIRASLRHSPVIIVLDGVDECEDKEEVAALIENLIAFFIEDPCFPLRFVIASRVEDHLHRELHASNQVQLLDLVGHTSNEDIKTALDVSIEKEMRGRNMPRDGSWPDYSDKRRLVKHIGGSYIFMTTIIKLLFAPSIKDGLTPMDRLPKILEMKPNFDDLYREILEPCMHFPFFFEILATIALAFEPLSIAQIADLLDIKTFKVTNVLINLHAIMQVPGDDRSPVTLWHTSLRDFLTSEGRSGPFFTEPTHHRLVAKWAIHVAASSRLSESHRYARNYGMDHLFQYLQTVDQNLTCYDGLLEGIMPDLIKATFRNNQTALEAACRVKEWKLVSALVNAGANLDTRFQGGEKGVALHAACHYGAKEMVYFLLDKGANPNIAAVRSNS
ncbi:hypothetical protein FA13DRAFT_1148620 [Coprinellus micaceus]|uniref:Nephrocystin 3-like N-terminal domain-containing protein n=1 Tax=Coprinellus micaceus TaxID=71717 RepID=A0A4Y7SUR7_COPMI|nr:hypothetical protein FA13DRAFT_1148620 [Coprinellus micaceus]